ncbi:MAG: Asp-tRNA(Asn)/Glu-tRNA(Gln) amidotransferase subunit GatB [Methanobacteriota archaeon]|nr:MAG: Asp-tRNA(Asn)/Glu-tRNA(Gln) amidotransferase subunit GatB [Euryarchaeota archaeon]
MPIIGLEIHVQLNTESKLFCLSKNSPLSEPNTLICEICTAQPGAKPMLPNERAIELAYIAGNMLKCSLNSTFYFMRKHYFYPDLPSGYQRTSTPLGEKGKFMDVGITELHVEEDPGRYELRKGLVDYNRAGVPLIEIVTEPDMGSAEEAEKFLRELERGLKYYGIIKKDGTVKVDANISIEGHERVEVKNINSFENVATALSYEIRRQEEMIGRGEEPARETRHFDEAKGITKSLRKKETELDYRYMPDPDLYPVTYDTSSLTFPERPWERAERFISTYGIDEKTASILTQELALADLMDYLAGSLDAKKSANWLKGPFKKQLNYRELSVASSKLSKEDIRELASLYFEGKLSDDAMEKILIEMLDKGGKPQEIAEKRDLFKMEDDALLPPVKKVIEENEKAVEDFKNGEEKALSFLVGKVMQLTRGKADPKKAADIIRKLLS